MSLRNRIKGHRTVRAGDLLVNEANFRDHPEGQREALAGLLERVGKARSVLAYEVVCPDCGGSGDCSATGVAGGCDPCDGTGLRLKLIDGHLRRDMDPDDDVVAEVLDVTEEEASILLASVDPLSQMAGVDGGALARLLEETDLGNPALQTELDRLVAANPPPVAFEPNLLPQTEHRQVTSQDVDSKAEQMQSRIEARPTLVPVHCPKCRKVFHVNRDTGTYQQ